MPIQIDRKEVITVRDDKGTILNNGDPIIIRVGTEDIVCRYVGIISGYFVTHTLEDGKENKYRQGSIASVERISGIRSYPAEPEAVTDIEAEED